MENSSTVSAYNTKTGGALSEFLNEIICGITGCSSANKTSFKTPVLSGRYVPDLKNSGSVSCSAEQ